MLTGFRESWKGNKSDGYPRKSTATAKIACSHIEYLLKKGICLDPIKIYAIQLLIFGQYWWKICDDEMDDRDRSPRQSFGTSFLFSIIAIVLWWILCFYASLKQSLKSVLNSAICVWFLLHVCWKSSWSICWSNALELLFALMAALLTHVLSIAVYSSCCECAYAHTSKAWNQYGCRQGIEPSAYR